MTARSWLYFNHRYDSHLLRFLLRGLLFFHAEEGAEEGARSDHTYRSRPLPSAPPSLQFPCHLCASPSACNSTTTRPWTSAEESIHHRRKEGARRRKTEGKQREKQRERQRAGGGLQCTEGEVRKSESETPWNLITERVVSGRGGEQIKLA